MRVTVITGARDCFTSGNDIGDFVRANQGGGGDLAAPLGFLRALASFEKPLVAAVGGVAIGIGTTLLLHCDLVFASPNARFKTPFVDLALVPEAASSLLLPRLIGERRAAQMLLLGEQIDAPTALAWGLINGVADDPDAAAQTAARKLATCAPASLRATKSLIRRPQRELILEAMRRRRRGIRRAAEVARGDGSVPGVRDAPAGRLLEVLTRRCVRTQVRQRTRAHKTPGRERKPTVNLATLRGCGSPLCSLPCSSPRA